MSDSPIKRGNGFNRRFVALAEARLEPGVFVHLAQLVEEEIRCEVAMPIDRSQPEAVPVPAAAKQKANKAAIIERVSAALNDRPVTPVVRHVAERVEERLGIEVGPHEIAELTQFILRGGSNVTRIKREVRSVDHYRAIWRGMEFIAIMAVDRKELITVRRAQKQRPQKRPRQDTGEAREKARQRTSVRDIDLEDCADAR